LPESVTLRSPFLLRIERADLFVERLNLRVEAIDQLFLVPAILADDDLTALALTRLCASEREHDDDRDSSHGEETRNLRAYFLPCAARSLAPIWRPCSGVVHGETFICMKSDHASWIAMIGSYESHSNVVMISGAEERQTSLWTFTPGGYCHSARRARPALRWSWVRCV
jgi:hypothetical protein